MDVHTPYNIHVYVIKLYLCVHTHSVPSVSHYVPNTGDNQKITEPRSSLCRRSVSKILCVFSQVVTCLQLISLNY